MIELSLPPLVVGAVTAIGLVVLLRLALTRTVLGRGLAVPLRAMLVRPETAEYPERPREVAPRFHGRHQLNRYDDGLEKCIGCELCAWACPADAILVQGADNTTEERYSPGERYAVDYQINYNRCILCGLCIEACPTRALTMTHDYELADASREGLIWTKDMLLIDVPIGGYDTPHTDREVRDRGFNYYGGLAVTPPTRKGDDVRPASAAPLRLAASVVPPTELSGPHGTDGSASDAASGASGGMSGAEAREEPGA